VSENKNTKNHSANKYNFRYIQAYGGATFGQGNNGPIMLGDLNCNGNETNISECPSHGWLLSSCNHQHDAGISCSEYTFNIAYFFR
jgi:hypothetical protein